MMIALYSQNIGVSFGVVVFISVTALIALGLFWLLWRIATVKEQRQLRERVIVGDVATVLDQHLPLAEGLRCAADSETGLVRARLANLALSTERGEPLALALREDVPECSGMVYSLAQAGEASRQLPGALALAERMLIERDQRGTRVGRGAAGYVLILLLAMVFLVTMIMIVIMPKFQEIFYDFDTVLPPLTVWLIDVLRFVASTLIILALITFCVFAILAFLRLRRRTPEKPRCASRWADTVRWMTPGLHTMQRSEGLALAFRVMRLAVNAHQPLSDAARHAAQLDVNLYLRDQLNEFAEYLGRGENPGEAARRSGLGNISAVALAAGARAGNLGAALRYAADYHEAVLSRWWIFLRQISWPVCTLILATMVGTIVLAMFTPLVALINSVEPW